ncbi:hypothetical protein D6D00_10400 [Aureobasidium pullulans]|nr:hypothetical protein D6D00_10400 [Aureobasidium pullulans]
MERLCERQDALPPARPGNLRANLKAIRKENEAEFDRKTERLPWNETSRTLAVTSLIDVSQLEQPADGAISSDFDISAANQSLPGHRFERYDEHLTTATVDGSDTDVSVNASVASKKGVDINNHTITAASPPVSHPTIKTTARQRKYHTYADREEAQYRYRKRHRAKVSTGLIGSSATDSKSSTADSNAIAALFPAPKLQDLVESSRTMRASMDEIADMETQLAPSHRC